MHLIPLILPYLSTQYFVNPVTVFGMLKVLNVPANEYLLQTGSGSVLGRQMIQLCKHFGIKTVTKKDL
jgi:trans-2-enoyl-CoA reductase